jgi:hypothetical protein|tara:strand:- start:163 stop:516 length:354 start_codon:yes stop_codon:yes gene_type:complete
MLSIEKRDWTLKALCKDLETDIFYPQRGESTVIIKTICRACPVVKPCLEYAMRNMEKFGIWGGTSERERRRMRSAKTRYAKDGVDMTISQLIRQSGINLTVLKKSQLEDFSGEDWYQ